MTPSWRRRGLLAALLLSLLLHLALVTSPGWHLGLLTAETPELLEATLAPPPPPPAPKPAPPKPAPRPAPSVASTPVPGSVSTAAPTPPATPVAAEPSPPPALQAKAEEAPEAPIPLPRRGKIRFGVYKGASGERSLLVGRAIHEWQHDGKRYRLSATTETVGLAALFKNVKILQSSEGGFLKGELKPTLFRQDRGEGDVVESAFDWAAASVSLQNGQTAAIGEGAEDVLSMFYQLMQAAQRGEGFVMAVANGRKVERYAFEWLGEERLEIKAGQFRAWHVRVRSAVGGAGDGRGVDVTEVWLGKEVAGLPIRIRYTDRKGEVGDQIAEAIEYDQ
ncbi:hypothetical protein DLREEDagrD3_20180 [Denitratisoma sp. agr-D3]